MSIVPLYSQPVTFTNAIHLYPLPKPNWATNFTGLPIPKLSDLPKDPSFLKFYLEFYEHQLLEASQDPCRWKYDPKNFEYIRKFIGICENAPSLQTFTHGIPIRTPYIIPPIDQFDCKTSSPEDNILHIHDLLSDTAAGKVAGPFKIKRNTTHVIVCPKPGIYFKVPFVISLRFCTLKMKI